MITTLAFLLCYIGFTLFALTQTRPRKMLCEEPELPNERRQMYRWLGAALLSISLVLIVNNEGWSFGSIVWGTVISLAAIAVSLTITFASATARKLLHAMGL